MSYAIRNLFQSGKRCAVIPHNDPDGDVAGSCSAMVQVLAAQGMEARIVSPNSFPLFLRFLAGIKEALIYTEDPVGCKAFIDSSDIILILDHNNTGREGGLQPLIEASQLPRVIIDHHLEPPYAEHLISEPERSSTAELLYDVIVENWGRDAITPEVANSLYAGIHSDTKGFEHNASHPRTFRIVADLLDLGLDKDRVYAQLCQSGTENRIRLRGYLLSQKMQILDPLPIAVIAASREELSHYDYKDGDTEGVVNEPLSIARICISVFISERHGIVKISFRSTGTIPVNEWAKMFGGNGHRNAAGANLKEPLESVIEKIHSTAELFCRQYLVQDGLPKD